MLHVPHKLATNTGISIFHSKILHSHTHTNTFAFLARQTSVVAALVFCTLLGIISLSILIVRDVSIDTGLLQMQRG